MTAYIFFNIQNHTTFYPEEMLVNRVSGRECLVGLSIYINSFYSEQTRRKLAGNIYFYIDFSYYHPFNRPIPGRLSRCALVNPRRPPASLNIKHRKRINTEEKAKVVAAVWGQNLINSLPRQLFWFEEKDEFTLFFKSSWCNSSYCSNRPTAECCSKRGKELNNSVPQIAATTFYFSSIFILLLWH